MKKILASLAIVSTVFFASCQKNEVPGTTGSATPISVEYRVTSVSGHVTVDYLSPVNNQMSETKQTVDRTNFSVTFNSAAGTFLQLKAYNAIPSHDQVTVEIYVNGVLYQTGQTDTPGGVADAEGKY